MNDDISLTERYMLVAYVTGESFNQVQLKHRLGQQVMTEKQQNEYIQLLFRRMNGEPIQTFSAGIFSVNPMCLFRDLIPNVLLSRYFRCLKTVIPLLISVAELAVSA